MATQIRSATRTAALNRSVWLEPGNRASERISAERESIPSAIARAAPMPVHHAGTLTRAGNRRRALAKDADTWRSHCGISGLSVRQDDRHVLCQPRRSERVGSELASTSSGVPTKSCSGADRPARSRRCFLRPHWVHLGSRPGRKAHHRPPGPHPAPAKPRGPRAATCATRIPASPRCATRFTRRQTRHSPRR